MKIKKLNKQINKINIFNGLRSKYKGEAFVLKLQ